ncbi:hypothetical protein GGI22_003762, partial [Coemansia erecta]
MDVSEWSWLAHDARSSQDIADSILFVEGTARNGVQCFFLRSLNETVPLERLTHFLRAGRYPEAEAFAENCNIPLSLVYRRRIEEVLNGDPLYTGTSSERDGAEQHLYADKALDLLGHIDDVDFVVESCLRMPCPSYAGTHKLLEYSRSLAAESAPASVPRILNTIQRLGTWSMINDQSTTVCQGDDCFDSDAWHTFRTADLASYLRSYIAQGDILSVSALWRRHHEDARLSGDISSAIQGFSMDIDTHSLVCWLRTEVLPMLGARQQWHEIAVWVEQRARALASKRNRIADALLLANLLDIGSWSADFGNSDRSDSASVGSSLNGKLCAPVCGPFAITPQNFIESSIYTAKWTVELARVSGVSVFSAQSDSGTLASSDSALQSCLFLRKQLLDLVYLRDKHTMVLTLEEFEQLSYSAIATELLDRVGAPELLDEAYFAHFVPYSEHHQIDFAQTLREYCIEMMDAVQRDDSDHGTVATRDNADGNDDDDEDDGGIALAALSAPGSIGRHTWEPRVLGLLACLYSSCIGRHDRTTPSSDSSGSAHNVRFPPLTSSRIGLLTTYSELILEVMRRSSIPWSSSVDSAIGNAISLFSHYASMDTEISRCHSEIKDQFRLMCLKRMLLSHGLSDFHIANTRMAYPLLQWLVRKTDDESIMADVLQLVDVYHHLSRTSAYVLRLQVLCEVGDSERTAGLMMFIDATEYGIDAEAAIQRYMPMEVARRGICWIREVLDNMPFGESASRVQFRQLVGSALAIVRSLKELSHRYARSSRSSLGSNGIGGLGRYLVSSEIRALKEFVDQETSVFSVVWQLLVDGGIMVSPGELDQENTRKQILSELLEQHWLRGYLDQPNSSQLSKGDGTDSKSAYKGKRIVAIETSAGSSAPRSARSNNAHSRTPIEMLGLPLIPAKIKTLSAMLRFGSAQLGQKIVSKCLSLGLYTMALDMCQQLIESLKPIPHTTTVSPASDEWAAAIHALVSCERELSAFLANVAAGDVDSGSNNIGPALPGRAQGSLIRRLATVCQAACLKCASHGYLVSFLDAYSCWELAQAIFSQTTDGDFALLTKQAPLVASKSRVYLNGSISHPLASSSSNPEPSDNDHLELPAASEPHDGAFSSWLSPLYINTYSERGLVLDTNRAMHLVYRFASALRWLPTAEMCANSRTTGLSSDIDAPPPVASAEQKNKAPLLGNVDYGYAKMDEAVLKALSVEDIRYEVIRRCSDLAVHLAQNRHWMLAVQAFELAISHLARSSFVTQASDISAYSGDALDELRQRLSTGGISEDEMAAFFSTCGSESSPLTGIQALVSKSLQRSLQQRGIDAVFIFSTML